MQSNWEQYAVDPKNPSTEEMVDWEQYAAPQNTQSASQQGELPLPLQVGMSLMKPMGVSIPERTQALKRGAQDIGEGAKQAYLTIAEKLGHKPQGTTADYTSQVQKGREEYEKTEGAKDILSQLLRGGVAHAPSFALGGLGAGIGKNLLMRMLGTGAGAASGSSIDFLEDPNKRFEHMLQSGAVGTAIPAIPALGRGIGSVAKKLNPAQLSAKNIANEIVAAKKANIERYSKEYKDLFNRSRDQNASRVEIDPEKIKISRIKEHFPDKYTENLDRFLKTRDIEFAHDAQSDLKKYIRNLDRREKSMGLSKPEQNSKKDAEEAIKQIKDAMFKGHPELKNEYNTITAGYKKDVVPYKSKNISDYQEGEIYAKKLLKSLSEKPKIIEKHKRLSLRNKLAPASKLALGGLGAYEGYNLLSHLLGNKK